MVINNLNKISVYDWFRQMQGWHRVDFVVGLLEICNPLELRFIGHCIEDYAQTDYQILHEQEVNANDLQTVKQMQNTLLVGNEEFQSHISISLALLHSDNYSVANAYSDILDKLLQRIDINALLNQQLDEIINEYMLILTLASTHPAFSFGKKNLYRERFLEFEKLIYKMNTTRRRCLNRSSEETKNQQYLNNVYQHKLSPPVFCSNIGVLSNDNSLLQNDKLPNTAPKFLSTDIEVIVTDSSHYSTVTTSSSTTTVTYCMPGKGTLPLYNKININHKIDKNVCNEKLKTSLNSDTITKDTTKFSTAKDFVLNIFHEKQSTKDHVKVDSKGNISIELLSIDDDSDEAESLPLRIRKVNVTLEDKKKSSSERIQFMVSWSDKTKSDVWKTLPEVIQFCKMLNQHKHKSSQPNKANKDWKCKDNNIHWKFVRLQHFFRNFPDLPEDILSSKQVLNFFNHRDSTNSPVEMHTDLSKKDQPQSPNLTNSCTVFTSSEQLNHAEVKPVFKNSTNFDSTPHSGGDISQKKQNLSQEKTITENKIHKRIGSNHKRKPLTSSRNTHVTSFGREYHSEHNSYEFDTEEDISSYVSNVEDNGYPSDSLQEVARNSCFSFEFDDYSSDVKNEDIKAKENEIENILQNTSTQFKHADFERNFISPISNFVHRKENIVLPSSQTNFTMPVTFTSQNFPPQVQVYTTQKPPNISPTFPGQPIAIPVFQPPFVSSRNYEMMGIERPSLPTTIASNNISGDHSGQIPYNNHLPNSHQTVNINTQMSNQGLNFANTDNTLPIPLQRNDDGNAKTFFVYKSSADSNISYTAHPTNMHRHVPRFYAHQPQINIANNHNMCIRPMCSKGNTRQQPVPPVFHIPPPHSVPFAMCNNENHTTFNPPSHYQSPILVSSNSPDTESEQDQSIDSPSSIGDEHANPYAKETNERMVIYPRKCSSVGSVSNNAPFQNYYPQTFVLPSVPPEAWTHHFSGQHAPISSAYCENNSTVFNTNVPHNHIPTPQNQIYIVHNNYAGDAQHSNINNESNNISRNNQSKSNKKSSITSKALFSSCSNCGGLGHKARECTIEGGGDLKPKFHLDFSRKKYMLKNS